MARSMSIEEAKAFCSVGTRTGHLATTRADGRPHVAPVWFVVDGDDIVLMTGADTVKGRNLAREGRAAVSVDDPSPPYSFVLVEGPVTLSDDLDEMLAYATRIGRRYMGDAEAESYGRRNAAPGELLVRLRMEKVTAAADIAD